MGHTPTMADVILVHGAGTGGWLWDDVAALLRAEGHRVLAPTLRGVGGPATAAERDVDLSTHIDAVTELAEAEQLDRPTLVGFSYGGFVVTGAAARLGDRVTEVIYLDAFVPQPGRSFFDLLPEPARAAMQASATAHGDGWRIPPAPLEMVGGLGALEPGVDLAHVHAVLAHRGFHPWPPTRNRSRLNQRSPPPYAASSSVARTSRRVIR